MKNPHVSAIPLVRAAVSLALEAEQLSIGAGLAEFERRTFNSEEHPRFVAALALVLETAADLRRDLDRQGVRL